MIPYNVNHTYKAAALGKKGGEIYPYSVMIPKLKDVWNPDWKLPEELPIQDNEVWEVVDKRVGAFKYFTAGTDQVIMLSLQGTGTEFAFDIYDKDMNFIETVIPSSYLSYLINVDHLPDVFIVRIYRHKEGSQKISNLVTTGTNVVAIYDAGNILYRTGITDVKCNLSTSETTAKDYYSKLIYYKSINSPIFKLSGHPNLIRADFSESNDNKLEIDDCANISELMYPSGDYSTRGARDYFIIGTGSFTELKIPAVTYETSGYQSIKMDNLKYLQKLDLSDCTILNNPSTNEAILQLNSQYMPAYFRELILPEGFTITPQTADKWLSSTGILAKGNLTEECLYDILDRLQPNDTETTISIGINLHYLIYGKDTITQMKQKLEDKGYNYLLTSFKT